MATEHKFTIEVTAIPHRAHRDERAEQGWKHQTETAIASALLYQKGAFSAIVRVVDGTPAPGGQG